MASRLIALTGAGLTLAALAGYAWAKRPRTAQYAPSSPAPASPPGSALPQGTTPAPAEQPSRQGTEPTISEPAPPEPAIELEPGETTPAASSPPAELAQPSTEFPPVRVADFFSAWSDLPANDRTTLTEELRELGAVPPDGSGVIQYRPAFDWAETHALETAVQLKQYGTPGTGEALEALTKAVQALPEQPPEKAT